MKVEHKTIENNGESEIDIIARDVNPDSNVIRNFFDTHGQFLEKYAGDSSIKIEPAPSDLGTFAINLEDGILYAEPKFFIDKGYSPDKAMFATLHEYEHFKEMKELLDQDDGNQIWQRHQQNIKVKRRLHILDNCFDDIKVNRQVVDRAPVLGKTRNNLYQDNLFSETDYQDQPRHLQFAYGLLRRAMLPGEETVLSSEVQSAIDELDGVELRGVKLIEYATGPETPMSMRLKLQKRFLEPIYEKFFQEDVEKKENKNQESGDSQKGEGGGEEDTNGKKKSESKSGNEKKQDKPFNPEDYFQNEYNKYDNDNPQPIDYSDEKIREKIEEYIKSQQDKNAEQEILEAYARAEGVSLKEIRDYQRFFAHLEDLENPETGEKVLEELRKIFKRIIAERKKETYAPKHPMSEGDILVRPAEAVVAVMSGEDEPEVWQTIEKKELFQELYGDFDVTLVCDRSGSMAGAKATEQQKATALILEALKDFCDELTEMKSELKHDLNVRSEVWGFGGVGETAVIKPLSEQLTEKQRVDVYQILADTPGDNTMDFLALEKIKDEVTAEEWKKIKDKKLRKVIIVLTDGKSDNKDRVRSILQEFEDAGVAVAGVGITSSGQSAESTYAPNGQVCENINQLAVVLSDLLKQYLKDLLVKK